MPHFEPFYRERNKQHNIRARNMSVVSALQNQVTVPSTAKVSPSNDDGGKSKIEEEKLQFLNILIAQLQNQNPLDPMDTAEYTNQLVMYSQLDQQLEMKQGIVDLNATMSGQSSMLALDYLGEVVELATNVAPVQDGVATWNYTVQGNPDEVTIQIVNENDEILVEEDGKIEKGIHQYVLDAKKMELEDGTAVFMKVIAKDDGNDLSTGMTSFAKVDGITGSGKNPNMTSGTVTFAMDDILKVSNKN